MSAMSDYLENKLVDHIFRGTSFTAPTNTYIALYTAAPSDTGGGTEVTGGSYARVTMSAAGATWTNTQSSGTGVSSGTGGVISNVAAITFPAPSASWGVVTHFAVYDAATVGNELFWGVLTASKTVNNGDPAPNFAIGALTVTLA